MSTINDTDLLLVNRGGVDYKITAQDLLDANSGGGGDCPCNCPEFTAGHPSPNPKDGHMFSDLYDSQCPARLFIYYESKKRWIEVGANCTNMAPWGDHDGGIFHVKNTSPWNMELSNGPYKMWNPDGTNLQETSTIRSNEEKVFVTSPDASNLFKYKNFEFHENTDVSRVTNMAGMFDNAYFDDPNRNLEGWSVCNVTCMKGMWYNMEKKVYSDLSNWGVENCPDPDWESDFQQGFLGTQPKWGEPNGPCSCKDDSSSIRKVDREQEEWEDYLRKKKKRREQMENEQVD